MINVPAIYENGVLRLTEPVALHEGQRVSVSISPETSDADWERRIRNARSYDEWAALANACSDPAAAPDYDVVAAINENRRLTGFRVPDAELAD